jgi:hypothetical protein
MTSPLIGYAQPKSTPPNPNFHLAYSEHGYRRKESSGKPKPSQRAHASRAPIV